MPGSAPRVLMESEEALRRMEDDQAAELKAYILGVQAVIWSMQWVKGGRALRNVSTAAKHGRRPFDVLTELTSGNV